MVDQKLSQGQIHGLKMKAQCSAITHLFFADDTIIFGQASYQEAEKWKEIIDVYYKFSGQRVSVEKSSIKFGAGCLPEVKQ